MSERSERLYLGVEIGGTKLQLAVGRGGERFIDERRLEIQPTAGARGILDQIRREGSGLLQRHAVAGIGIGFGGPVDEATGQVVTSHQVAGWEQAPLVDWCEATFKRPTTLANDCDAAALAEARYGAGRSAGLVFYVTAGSGVGGGFVLDGQLYGRGRQRRPAVAEVGHLRPGLSADKPELTVESLASGWGIAAAAAARVTGNVSRSLDALHRTADPLSAESLPRKLENARRGDQEYAADLLARASGDIDQITAKLVAQAAAEGNLMAAEVLHRGVEALGWAIAQVITLLAPERIVVGGGVSLIGESLFFEPLRRATSRYVFPPLSSSYEIVPAALGESVVLHGALALAEMTHAAEPNRLA